MKILIIAAAAAAVALSGCGTLGKQGDQLAPIIDALARAGCSGVLHNSIGAQTAAGISPGAAHVEHTFDGKCDARDAKQPAAPAAPLPAVPPPAPSGA